MIIKVSLHPTRNIKLLKGARRDEYNHYHDDDDDDHDDDDDDTPI